MATGLLSLKWNNHKSTFFHVLSTIRSKESYCDVTLACDGRFYSLHKFVLSTCSEYFEEMFERTQCKHPVIVLKDIKHDDLEALLNYMYVGEVNVVQEKLAGLIKAAECLKIKGLAVPDEDPMESKESLGREQQHKRSQRTEDSPRAKRRRRENSTDVSDGHSSARPRHVARNREHSNSNLSSKTDIPLSEENQHLDAREDDGQDSDAREDNTYNKENRQTNASNRSNRSSSSQKSKNEPEEVTLDDDEVKAEPIDPPPEEEDIDNHEGEQDNKDALHQELGFDSEAMGGDNYDEMDQSALNDQLQSMEDVVADAMPGSSGFQENSFPMWEGEGSLSNFPVEGFSGENSQARQMAGVHQSSSLPPPSTKTFDLQQHHSRGNVYPSSSPHPSRTITHFLGSTSTSSSTFSLPSSNSATVMSLACDNAYESVSRFTATSRRREDSKGDGTTSSGTSSFAYSCVFCPKSFPHQAFLRRHELTHTGEKPFACSLCSYGATQRFNLARHMKSRHPEACSAASSSSSSVDEIYLARGAHYEQQRYPLSEGDTGEH